MDLPGRPRGAPALCSMLFSCLQVFQPQPDKPEEQLPACCLLCLPNPILPLERLIETALPSGCHPSAPPLIESTSPQHPVILVCISFQHALFRRHPRCSAGSPLLHSCAHAALHSCERADALNFIPLCKAALSCLILRDRFASCDRQHCTDSQQGPDAQSRLGPESVRKQDHRWIEWATRCRWQRLLGRPNERQASRLH